MSDEDDSTTAYDPWIIQPEHGSTLSNLGIYLHIKNGLPYGLYRIALRLRQGGDWFVIGGYADANGAYQGSVDHIPLDVIRFYVTQVGNSYGTGSSVNLITPAPVFDQHAIVVRFPGRIVISGYVPLNPGIAQMPAGADYSVDIHGGGNGAFIESFPVARNGKWTATVDVPNGKRWFAARFNVKGLQQSDWAAQNIDVIGLAKPVINRPAQGIVESRTPTITGSNGYSGANIRIVEADQGGVLFGQAIVADNGTWAVNVTTALSKALIKLTCEQVLQGISSDWAQAQEFLVLPTPVVSAPTTVVDLRPTILGTTTGFESIQVDIYRDMTNEKIGQGVTTASGTWSAQFTQNLEPGVRTITAQLNYSGRLSTRSAPVALTVRPPHPAITQVCYSGTTIIFEGTGFPNATIEVHPGSGSPNATALVDAQGKFETTPIVLLPGTTGSGWGVRQKIPNGSGWIFSIYHPDEPDFSVPTQAPTISTVTLDGLIPTVTGLGAVWPGHAAANIEVKFTGTKEITLPLATVTAAGDWLATSDDAIAPDTYTVSARQLMNTVYSESFTATTPLIIKPLAPADIEMVRNGLSATFSGSCWPSASLILLFKFEDNETSIPATGTSEGNWTSLPITFVPGQHTFTVTQSVSGLTSPSAGPIPLKVETPVPVITFPGNQQETGLQPEIKGNGGYVDCEVNVFNAMVQGPSLGTGKVDKDGNWVVKLSKELPLGPQSLYAVQTYGTQNSAQSKPVLFDVMVPKATLSLPSSDVPRRSVIRGTGVVGAKITIEIDSIEYPIDGGITVDSDGGWEAKIYLHEVGPKKIVIIQKYAGGERRSDPYTFQTVTNAPEFESPNGGESVDPKSVVVSGFGIYGDMVKFRQKGFTELVGQVPVGEKGTWSVKLNRELVGATPFTLEAWSTRNSLGGDFSEAIINLQSLAPPIIVSPAAGDVRVSMLTFSGRGLKGARIVLADAFNYETLLAPATTVDANGRWFVEGDTHLPAGAHWVVAQQTLNGIASPWVRSGRFIIEEPPSGFSAPTLDRPRQGEDVGLQPVLAGSGVVGALVYIRHKGKDLVQTWVDWRGSWTVRLPALDVGAQTISVVQARYGFWSANMVPDRTFNVVQVSAGFAAPTIDSPVTGAIVDRQFWITGKGIPGAVINVHKQGDGNTVYGTAVVDAYGDWCACINRELPVDDFPFTAQQILDGKLSDYFLPSVVVKVADVAPITILDSHTNGEQVAPVMLLKGRGSVGASVVVYKSRDQSTHWGTATVDTQGYWEVITKPFPLGKMLLNVAQFTASGSSWGHDYEFVVVDAG